MPPRGGAAQKIIDFLSLNRRKNNLDGLCFLDYFRTQFGKTNHFYAFITVWWQSSPKRVMTSIVPQNYPPSQPQAKFKLFNNLTDSYRVAKWLSTGLVGWVENSTTRGQKCAVQTSVPI